MIFTKDKHSDDKRLKEIIENNRQVSNLNWNIISNDNYLLYSVHGYNADYKKVSNIGYLKVDKLSGDMSCDLITDGLNTNILHLLLAEYIKIINVHRTYKK